MEEVFPEEGKKFMPISDCSRQIVQGQGNVEALATWSWTKFSVNIATNTSCHVQCYCGTFTCLCQSDSRCWKADPPQCEAEARIAQDTCLLVDKRTNSRNEGRYLDRTGRKRQSKRCSLKLHKTRIRFHSWQMYRRWYWESQLSIGWTKEKVKASCVLGSNDDTYQAMQAKKLAENIQHKQCFHCRNKGHVKSDCRIRQRGMKKAKGSGKPFDDRKQTAANTDDEITGAVVEGMPNMASSSHDYLFAVMEKSRLGNQNRQMEEAGRSLDHLFRARTSVTASRNDVSWTLVDSGSGGAHHPCLERVLPGAGMNHKLEFIGTKQVSCQLDSPVPDCVRRLTRQGNM